MRSHEAGLFAVRSHDASWQAALLTLWLAVTAIGVAVVDPHRCIAWKNNEYCAVCDEYCPYKAVKLVKHGDVMCPVVETAKCRGCGACESACPAEPIAIVVKPVRQTV